LIEESFTSLPDLDYKDIPTKRPSAWEHCNEMSLLEKVVEGIFKPANNTIKMADEGSGTDSDRQPRVVERRQHTIFTLASWTNKLSLSG
jgi:hypothetical protein